MIQLRAPYGSEQKKDGKGLGWANTVASAATHTRAPDEVRHEWESTPPPTSDSGAW